MKKPSKKLVSGAGRNDADYVVELRARIGGKKKQLWVCPFYRTWRDMLKRCYNRKYQSEKPTYVGCSVAPEWHSFSGFRAWMVDQDWEGNHLDKDILVQGNKVYGPETCVFVPSGLNAFLTDHSAARGEWPIGVNWQEQRGKFQAKCRNPFTQKQEHIGLFTCPQEAHAAWRKRKHEHAVALARVATDPRVAEALARRYA